MKRWMTISPKTRPLLLTALYGVGGGLAAVAFQFVIQWIYHHTFVAWSQDSLLEFALKTFALMALTSLIAGFLLQSFCPDAAGSGIPQVKVCFWRDFGVIPWRAVWVKFVGGALTVGGGASLGREGPTVHIASGLASNMAGSLGVAKQNRRSAVASGAAAGLAAAFNAPLSSITFVLEEIIGDLNNSRYLAHSLLASVLGASVVYFLVGRDPAFYLPPIQSYSWVALGLSPVVAAASAGVGVFFQNKSLQLRVYCRSEKQIPRWLWPAVGVLLTWIIGVVVFGTTRHLGTGHLGVFGLGYDDLSAGLNAELSWKLALVLVAAKLAGTILCYGTGGCGGIFAPTLFFGGMTGAFLAGLIGLVIPLDTNDQIMLAVVGMSSCLGAVVRAPITSILIVFEMTHEFALMPALMIGTIVSQAISRHFCHENFYMTILEQDGIKLEKQMIPRDLKKWQQLPIDLLINQSPIVIDFSEPLWAMKVNELVHERYPVVREGKLLGIAWRKDLMKGEIPEALCPAITCRPEDTVEILQQRLIESPSGMVIVVEESGGIMGVVTLHDLLRTQAWAAEQEA